MRAFACTLLLAAAFGLFLVLSARAPAEEAAKPRDVAVTLQADGEHCIVRKVKIVCTDLASHLRDTLKLPTSTMIRLRAGRSASFEAIRRALTIIEKSGYRYPGARLREPGVSHEQGTP